MYRTIDLFFSVCALKKNCFKFYFQQVLGVPLVKLIILLMYLLEVVSNQVHPTVKHIAMEGDISDKVPLNLPHTTTSSLSIKMSITSAPS